MLPGCLEIGLSVSLNLLHTLLVVTKMSSLYIVGSYQNEQPLTDNFLEFGKHSHILNMNII